MFKILKEDKLWIGALIGIIVPAAISGIIYFIIILITKVSHAHHLILRPSTIILLSLIVNLILMRIFLINRNQDKTGRGILLATFIIAAVFFYIKLGQ